MNFSFKKITPVFVVALLGIIYLVIQFFIPGNDYNIFAYLVIFIVGFTVAFFIDRFLVLKMSYKKLFIAEIILLVSLTLWANYSSSYTEINIETSKPYFVVIYNENGLKKSDIPSKGLFSKSILIKSDSAIYINDKLEDAAQVNPPAAWNYSFSSNKIEKIINSKKVTIQIFAADMSELERTQLMEAEAKKLMK
ncbi:MAG: hypothetical protein ABI091_06225 [Ferruginibacter sp.]